MSGHTPGPWSFDGGIIQARCFSVDDDPDGPLDGSWFAPVAFCAPLSFQDDELSEWTAPGSIRANARLIAAAPDLLEALEELHGIVQWAIDNRSTEDMDSFTLQPACAAIAKARGEDNA